MAERKYRKGPSNEELDRRALTQLQEIAGEQLGGAEYDDGLNSPKVASGGQRIPSVGSSVARAQRGYHGRSRN